MAVIAICSASTEILERGSSDRAVAVNSSACSQPSGIGWSAVAIRSATGAGAAISVNRSISTSRSSETGISPFTEMPL